MGKTIAEQLLSLASPVARACASKLRYYSEQGAKNVIERRMGSGKNVPEALFSYRFTHCDGWHITKSSQERFQNERKSVL